MYERRPLKMHADGVGSSPWKDLQNSGKGMSAWRLRKFNTSEGLVAGKQRVRRARRRDEPCRFRAATLGSVLGGVVAAYERYREN